MWSESIGTLTNPHGFVIIMEELSPTRETYGQDVYHNGHSLVPLPNTDF